VTTRPIVDPENLLSRLPLHDPVVWVRNGEGLIGWGVAARLEVRGPERFSRTQRWWSNLCASFDVDDTVSAPGTGPVAFGSFSFDDETSTSIVILPRVIVGRRSGQAWMTTVGDDPGALKALPPASVPASPDGVEWVVGSRSAEDWAASVAEAVRRIGAGELDKVVLARDIVGEVSGELDPRHILMRLAEDYPSTWTFCVDNLIGATPELLVRRTGDLVTSRVLAGTVRRRSGHDDEGLAQALLSSDKDTMEHEYAVRSVAKALAAHCTDLDVPERPRVLPLANVKHLATDVTGRLADSSTVLALAASLHPTAAVCGTPTERAFTLIRDLEGMDRGRYAGPVGWFDRHGDGEFGIALRCAEIDVEERRIRAFAGCGIVAGSDPEDELAESRAKFLPIRSSVD
jgi:menaquinone-specific isochorismate synthase